MEYAQLASGGSAKSTVKGKSAAMKHLDALYLTKSLALNSSGSASSERLTQKELCSEMLFREFATYLTEFAMKLNGELYMSGTATQYLSAAKEMAMKKFPRKCQCALLLTSRCCDRGRGGQWFQRWRSC